jgi:hypothetical protein
VRVDLDMTPASTALVVQVTRAIAGRFTNARVVVDATVTNPARLMKLPGTLAMKGSSTPDRPHRMAALLSAFPVPRPATIAQLEEIAALAPASPAAAAPRIDRPVPYDGPMFNLDRWLSTHAAHLPPMSPWRSWRTTAGEGRKRCFRRCPWRAEHTNLAAFIGQLPSGAVVARCLHESCAGESWTTLRDLVESVLVIEV